jgi:hypothetical protein
MEQPPAKKPRSEAQRASFEKARAAREASILKKHQATMAAVPKPEQVQAPEPVAEEEEEQTADDSESITPPAQTGGMSPAAMELVEEEEQAVSQEPDVEYVDFDPDELRGQLSSTLQEIQQLKDAFQGLHSKHTELEQSWQQHNVKSANLLNFV